MNMSIIALAQSSWNQLGADIDGSTNDALGASMAMSADGSIVAVGASSANSSQGYVNVYQLSGSTWTQLGSTVSGYQSDDSFGSSVSLSSDGTVLAVGARTSYATLGANSVTGYVRVYEYDDINGWQAKGDSISGQATQESLGSAVSLSSDGNVLGIGVPGANAGGSGRGTTRVYKWNSTAWIQVGADIDGDTDGETSGISVSLTISGADTVIAIGSPLYSTNFENDGRVRIFTLANGDWGTPDVITGDPYFNLGMTVSLSDDASRLVTGAPQDFFFSPNPLVGRAMVYEYTTSWQVLGDTLKSSLEADEFGKYVALSGDGNTVIIAAPYAVAETNPNGRIEMYAYSSNWIQVGDSIPGAAADDAFGSSLAISGDGLTIGASSPTHSSSGQARMYNYGVPDNTPPVVTVNSLITSDQTPELSGTIDDETATISVTVNGQTTTPTINSGLNTWTLADNTLTSLAEGIYDVVVSATDEANNTGTDATTDELTIDLTAPTVTIDTLYTKNLTPIITGTVNDPDATIRVSVNGEYLGDATVNGATWSFPISQELIEGEYTVSVIAIDLYSNPSEAVEGYLKIDLTSPQPYFFNAALTNPTTYDRPINIQPFLVGIFFNDKSSNFVLEDITISGTAVGTTGLSYATADNYYILAIPLQDGLEDQKVTVTIPAGVFTDLAGNDNLEASVTITYDVTAPTITSIAPVGNDTTNLSAIPVQIVFNEKTIGLESTDLATTNVTSIDNLTTTDSLTYSMDVVPTAEGALSIQLPAEVVEDLAGNANTEASEVLQMVYDVTAPTVGITSATSITNISPLVATVTFREAVPALIADSLTITNGTVLDISTTDHTIYTVRITPDSPVDGSTSTAGVVVTVNLEANKVLDYAGNGNTAATPADITFDDQAPTVNMTTLSGQPITTANGSFDAYFAFSEGLGQNETITVDDINVTNGSKSGFQAQNVFGQILYKLTIIPDAGVLDLSVSVNAGVVSDNAGNPNAAATFPITIDTQGPIVTISSIANNPTNTSPIPVTFTFDEVVNLSTFSANDLVEGNFVASEPTSEDNITFVIDITPTAQGELSFSLKEGVVEDLAGNTNTETGSFAITYDDVAPTVTLDGASAFNSLAAFTVTLTFSEAITGLPSDSLTVTGATLGTISASSSFVYTVQLTPLASETITFGLKGFADLAGNVNRTRPSKSIVFDGVRPTLTISEVPETPVTSNSPITFTFTFSEDVEDFTIDDIAVTNGTKSNFAGSNSAYTAEIAPSALGEVIISISENVAFDAAGNGNEARSVSYVYNQPYSGGAGTETDPYLIANSRDFMDLTQSPDDWSSHFRQTADINFEGALLSEITTFGGSYNGNEFKLENYEHGSGNFRIFSSLFNTISAGATISNIQIVNDFQASRSSFGGFSILAEQCFGVVENCSYNGRIFGGSSFFGFVGTLGNGGRIDNVIIDLNLSLSASDGGVSASGLVHRINENAIVNNCSVNGSMTLNTAREKAVNMSGIAMYNKGRIENTTINLILSTSTSGAVAIGSFVHENEATGVIALCESYGSIGVTSGSETSGFVYLNKGQIQESYSTMSSNVQSHGGLACYNNNIVLNSFSVTNNPAVHFNSGELRDSYSSSHLVTSNLGTISNCYSFSPIEKFSSGFPTAKITNSFWQTETGTEESQAGALAKTQKQLKDINTYQDAGWDFNQVWHYPGSYPVHKWILEKHRPFIVSGKVINEGGSPFTAGTVYGYQYGGGLSEAQLDASGNFTIELSKGFNTLWVFPSNIEQYKMTYYGNGSTPDKAQFVHYDLNNVTIKMIRNNSSNNMTGKGTLTGNVVQSSGGGRIVQGRILEGDPLEGVIVFLVRVSDEEVMTSVVTDAEGKFEITGIPVGKYQLVLGVAGIDLNLEGSTFDMDEEGTPLTISAAVGDEGVVFSIAEVLGVEDEIELSVYPNPATRFVNVQVAGEASIRIIDLKGTVITEQSFSNEIELNVENLKESIYLMEIRNADGVSARKLIKK